MDGKSGGQDGACMRKTTVATMAHKLRTYLSYEEFGWIYGSPLQAFSRMRLSLISRYPSPYKLS